MLVPKRNTAQIVFRVGRINGNYIKLFIFCGYNPALFLTITALAIEQFILFGQIFREAICDLERFYFTKYGSAAITLFMG